MKSTKSAVLAIALAIVVSVVGVVVAPPSRADVSADVSFDLFYSNLRPHGSWLVSAQYGRVWQPEIYRAGWNPYYDGHWQYTEVGWTWVSDYRWGAIPYHYGTWTFDPVLGWVWVPGYTWAPAWVVFRTGPEYIGWAPVSPSFSIGASFGFGGVPSQGFVFVSTRDFVAPRIRTCAVPDSRVKVIVRNTTVVNNLVVQNNVVVNRGPDVSVIERASGKSIRKQRIERVERVAPFSRVTRERLAVDPGTSRRGIRAAEPVSARQDTVASDRRQREGTQRLEHRSMPDRQIRRSERDTTDSKVSRPTQQRNDVQRAAPNTSKEKQSAPAKTKDAKKTDGKKKDSKKQNPKQDKDSDQQKGEPS